IAIDWSGAGARWGDADCVAPDIDAFSPHGIDLVTRSDGAHALLVVNHGLREAVEFFELYADDGVWALAWRGCALPPGDPFINDVAGLADGGFFVTHMWDKSTPFETIVARYQAGENLGWVWAWQPGAGFSKLGGSDQLMPNGIALSPDERKVFVNVYLGNRTVRIDRETGAVDGAFDVRQPDNITVDADGDLWVASHQHDPLGQTCAAVTEGPCLLPYEIVRADPVSLVTEIVLRGEGPPMGYTTVALKVDDELYLGSAHGDRIASFPLEP
ncbi:MAG: SMP-30/gluconolactonase/LRE family protein, partial [Pseudomonadales bacterium]|nr:SMP-30/gluconolactonase/LRE family protein [Pseudomonadales bacterium]